MNDLKDCPFCGSGNVELEETTSCYYWVKCCDCGCQMWGDNSPKEANDRWNERKELK